MSSFLIYDNHCPLCKVYTKAFVKMDFLETEGRVAFSELEDEKVIAMVDWQRAKNEIPYIDLKENKTYYGVDALLKVLGGKWNFFNWYAKQSLLVAGAKQLYKFVSYNRRVIIAGKPAPCRFDAAPDFNTTYRLAYILFAWLVSSLMLTQYASALNPYLIEGFFGREFLIGGGQIIFQVILLLLFTRDKVKIFDYLGNLMTVSIAGSLLLFPSLIIGEWYSNALFALLYFGFIVMWMFVEHWRRVKLLELPIIISFNWIVYRIVIYYLLDLS